MGIAVTPGDILQITGWSNFATTPAAFVQITPLSWFQKVMGTGPVPPQFMGGDEPHNLQLSVTLGTGRTGTSDQLVITEQGVLEAAQVSILAGFATPPERGQTYVQLVLIRTQGVLTLVADYVYAGNAPSFPGVLVPPGPAGGHGNLRVIVGANPAAGVLPSTQPPVGVLWLLRSYEAVLVTDANAGNRGFALCIDDGTAANRIFLVNNTNVQAATLTRTWAWFIGTEGTGAAITDTQVVLPAYNLKGDPSLLLHNITAGGNNIRLVSTGALAFTATDDFAAPILEVEEWVMPN